MKCGNISLQEKVILGYINRNNVSKSQEVTITLYLVLVRTYIEYCLQLIGHHTEEGWRETIKSSFHFFTHYL